jgi:hypothetical protein
VNSTEIIVVDPAAEDTVPQSALAPRIPALQGTHVALIDNAKRNAEEMLHEIGSLLKSRYGVAEVSLYRKRSPSVPTPPEVLAEIASKADAVVHGVAD